jgi:hypothetical protein
MTTRRIAKGAALWLLLSAVARADTGPALNVKKPTRQEIIAFAAKCKRLDVQMDLVGRFGTDFSGLDLRGVDFRGAFIGVALLSPTGAYSYAMVFAFFMMVAEIVSGRASRNLALGLLATALVYVLLNVAVYIVIVAADSFSLFNLAFDIGVIFVGPQLAIGGAVVAAIIVWRTRKRFPALALLGFVIWMAGVGFANLWAIASASASV